MRLLILLFLLSSCTQKQELYTIFIKEISDCEFTYFGGKVQVYDCKLIYSTNSSGEESCRLTAKNMRDNVIGNDIGCGYVRSMGYELPKIKDNK